MNPKWRPLVVLGMTQFLMVLDASVMNVSISQLVKDFDTTVSTVQGVITFYSLVMAALMITGGKIGDIIGRRRALVIGLLIYAAGSGLTAGAWSVASLALGWSVLEGIGAALVMPAMAALIAGNYEGRDRIKAYGTLGGIAGAGIAVGPILGGYATTELSWRVVFVGEVLVALLAVAGARWLTDTPADTRPKLDVIGAVLSAAGLSLTVFAMLQASTWGWLAPRNSPIEPLGFSLTPFAIAAGLGLIAVLRWWQDQRERRGEDRLVRFEMFSITTLRAGLTTLLAQNTILMGVFFVIPLYLQIVLGLDALQTGRRMLPISICMFIVAMSGAALLRFFSPRTVIRAGLCVMIATAALMIGSIEPDLRGARFAVLMGLLGAGMGLMASQLGNVILGSVGAEERGEAGGLQYTAQQLGSSIGVALVGSIVLTSLSGAFLREIASDDRISEQTNEAVTVRVAAGVGFVPAEEARRVAIEAGLPEAEVNAITDRYQDAQLSALKSGLLAVTAIAAGALLFTRGLPSTKPEAQATEAQATGAGAAAPGTA